MVLREYLDELADESAVLKASGLIRLSGLTPEGSGLLAAAWPGIDVRRRRRIVQELVDLEEDNVELCFDEVFFRGLEDSDPEVRLQSIRGLWEYEGPNVVARLLSLMEADDSASVRAEAALALGRFVVLFEEGRLRERHFRRIEAGLRSLATAVDEVEDVRSRAIEAIGAHDDPWVRQAISKAYESGSRRLKVSSVHAMGSSGEPRWIPLLVRELNNEEAEIRYEAAKACGSLGDEGAVPHLIKLCSDPDDEVKQASIISLGQIGGSEARSALIDLKQDSSPAVREAAEAALVEIEFEENPVPTKPLV